MKVLTQHQCPECLGSGFNPNASKLNVVTFPEQHQLLCDACKGKRVIEKWMDAEEFMQTYVSSKVKLSQEEFKKAFNIK